MSRHRTYRVIVARSESYEIDLVAASEVKALTNAERLWENGARSNFSLVDEQDRVTFAIDEHASSCLRDISNEDRARWAEKSLLEFSRDTGSSMGREALHDLLCDLGHYARSTGLDFRDELHRAADVCAEEIAEEVLS
ncbi:MAG: hypothetical protein ABL904_24815 [Hyphomicrobiaceae bacterium]